MLFSAIFVRLPLTNSASFKTLRLTFQQVLHLIFSWSSLISWLMFIGDIVLIAFLSLHAYHDGTFTHT